MEPVRKHGSPELAAEHPAAGGDGRACTSRSGSPSPMPEPTRRRSARVPPRRGRVRRDAARRCGRRRRRCARSACCWSAPHRRSSATAPTDGHDAAARRSAGRRGRHPPDPQARAATLWCPAKCATTVCGCRSSGGSARKARASVTCSMASTPSASSSPPKRWASGGPRCARAVDYANERVVFGRPIGQNQGIAFPLAEAHMRLHAAELAVREAPGATTTGCPCGEAGEHGEVPGRRRQLLRRRPGACKPTAASATPREYHVERYWREARLMQIAPVSQEMVLQLHQPRRCSVCPVRTER